MERQKRRAADLQTKAHHVPVPLREAEEPPPVIIAVQGPPKVGKSTLIRSMVKHYTKQNITEIKGPITVVTGKKRRVTFIEVPNDVNAMVDIGKIADLVLLLVDASFGFEMETFEFLNVLQVHGFPKVLGVLTHLDLFKSQKTLKATKKRLKQRFWTEIYQGAKLFYLSGLIHRKYLKREIFNLSRYVALQKFRPLQWRTSHPYVLVDRVDDITDPEKIRQNAKCDRNVVLFGYIHGTNLKQQMKVHIPGAGDFQLKSVREIPDPCPKPQKTAAKSKLGEKDKLVYAPMADIGNIEYDADAMYIKMPQHSILYSQQVLPDDRKPGDESDSEDGAAPAPAILGSGKPAGPGEKMVIDLQKADGTLDDAIETAQLRLFSGSAPLMANEFDSSGESSEDEGGDSESDEDSSEDDGDVEDFEPVQTDSRKRRAVNFTENGPVEAETGELIFSKARQGATGKPKKQTVEFDDQLSEAENDGDFDEDGDDLSDGDDEDSDAEAGVAGARSHARQGKMARFANVSDGFFDEDDDEEAAVEDKADAKLEAADRRARQLQQRQAATSDSEDDDEEVGDDDAENGREQDSDDGMDAAERSALRWKEGLAERAAARFFRPLNLMKIVYGDEMDTTRGNDEGDSSDDAAAGAFEDDEEELFRPTNAKGVRIQEDLDASESAKVLPQDDEKEIDLEFSSELNDLLLARFVPRDGISLSQQQALDKADQRRKEKNLNDVMDDSPLFGDFEDLETGDAAQGSDVEDDDGNDGSGAEGEDGDAMELDSDQEDAELERILQEKENLKQQFDNDYDDGKGKKSKGKRGSGDGEAEGDEGDDGKRRRRTDKFHVQEDQDEDWYEIQKQKIEQQEAINRKEFSMISDPAQRAQLEGFRQGKYVRIEIADMHCEFIDNFSPFFPVVIGGLLPGEDQFGFVQVRLKKHRWHKKILKTHDPLVFSIGWRRFQSLPLYSIQGMRFAALSERPLLISFFCLS